MGGEGRSLSTVEVASILGLREARVRALARTGLCGSPHRGRRYAFSFQDLVVLRTARGLIEARVPAARVRRALEQLGRELGPESSLSGVRIWADGRHVAVRRGSAVWNPETGQGLLAFDVDTLAERVDELREAEKPPTGDVGDLRDADRAFERALELEDHDPAAAGEAYRRALELDPERGDAYVNLGRIVHEAGDAHEAVRLYREALARTPDDPAVFFNLALALEDTDGAGPAASCYERALQLDPEFADAHFNLAGLYEQLGRPADALRHYHAYKKLVDG